MPSRAGYGEGIARRKLRYRFDDVPNVTVSARVRADGTLMVSCPLRPVVAWNGSVYVVPLAVIFGATGLFALTYLTPVIAWELRTLLMLKLTLVPLKQPLRMV